MYIYIFLYSVYRKYPSILKVNETVLNKYYILHIYIFALKP